MTDTEPTTAQPLSPKDLYALVSERLLAGEDPATIAESLGLDTADESRSQHDCFDGLAVVLPGWVADDGNAEVEYPDAESGKAAAQEYVDDGDWGETVSTEWIRVYTWRAALAVADDHPEARAWLDALGDEEDLAGAQEAFREIYERDPDGDDGDYLSLVSHVHAGLTRSVVDVHVDRDWHSVEINPEEPECSGDEHDWRSPYSVVGGIKENPGVWGHGGGVIITEVCRHCGCYRVTDTWAQDRETGEQGLESVEYKDADDDTLAWVARKDAEMLAEGVIGQDWGTPTAERGRIVLDIGKRDDSDTRDEDEILDAVNLALPDGWEASWTSSDCDEVCIERTS